MTRWDEIKLQIRNHQRRLQKLKEQHAIHGISVDPKIPLEIEDIEATIADLQAELTALEQIPRLNPYRGLSTFREGDADVFFGRETFTVELVERVQQKLLVAVLGPSGSGKSSIVFAGLLPQLRREGHWVIDTFRPGHDPFLALAAVLLPHLEPELSEIDQLVERRKMTVALSQGDLNLLDIVGRILEKQSHAERLLLVADQFEELYTLCSEPETQQRFLDVLLQAIFPASPPPYPQVSLHLVLTLRADFLTQILAHRSFADALRDADVKLGPMTLEELRRAIEKPAETHGVTFEPGLTERILSEVNDQPGNLPLLEFALTALWEEQTKGELTHSAYEAVGRVEGALSRYADQVFGRLNEEEQARARRGQPVRAALSGTVIFAGSDGSGPACGDYRGYGLGVVIDTGDGWQTLYAHLARVEVSTRQTVVPETIIGLVGETGCVSGPHLHFGLRHEGVLVDPQEYMLLE